MSYWNGNALLNRLWQLFFGSKSLALGKNATSKRSFLVENLEERQLLSVTTLAGTDEFVEPGYVAQNVTVDVTDTTSASLMAALATSENMAETPVNVGDVIDEQLTDDVGVSYSLDGTTLTLENNLLAITSTNESDVTSEESALQKIRNYGPLTYAEYLDGMEISKLGDDAMMLMSCGCGCSGLPSSWSIFLGEGCGCGPLDQSYANSSGCHSQSDTWLAFQSGNTASIKAAGCFECCIPGNCLRIAIEVNDPDKEYFDITIIGASGTFTWTKPESKTNAEAKRDFNFTYFVFCDTNFNGKFDTGESKTATLGTLKTHVGYAEVWGWADQAQTGSEQPAGWDPNYPNTTWQIVVGHGSWGIVVGEGTMARLQQRASEQQLALLDTYANHKWGWGAVNELLPINGIRQNNIQNVPATLRNDDDYETRYGLDYPYDVAKGWSISLAGLTSVLEYTDRLYKNEGDEPEQYHIYDNNCVVMAVGAINAAGINFAMPATSQAYTYTITLPLVEPITRTVPADVPSPGAFGEALRAAGGTDPHATNPTT